MPKKDSPEKNLIGFGIMYFLLLLYNIIALKPICVCVFVCYAVQLENA